MMPNTITEIPAIKVYRVVHCWPGYSTLTTEVFTTKNDAEEEAKRRVSEYGYHCLILETLCIVELEGRKREQADVLQTSLGI